MKLPFNRSEEAEAKHRTGSDTPDASPNETEFAPRRRPRFIRPLKRTGIKVEIPSDWEDLPCIDGGEHDPTFIKILSDLGLPSTSPIPLVTRYSKPRPWSAEELNACIEAHERRIPIGLMSAALNRNPQDIIYRLLDVCHASNKVFREVGLGANRWTEKKKIAARKLFLAGLTAWRIGALFGVDFEGVEKSVYAGRVDYGHSKRNPFAICTDHKQTLNREILKEITSGPRVLDAFAGEGRFAAIVEELFPDSPIVCIEQSLETFKRAQEIRDWAISTHWIAGNNVQIMRHLASTEEQFDVIDIDPFVSCHEQIDLTWPLLKNEGFLFVTFGGEYRRSFIRTNRLAIRKRYGFYDSAMSNSEYLEVVPSFFLGWLAAQATENDFVFQIKRCVRYPNTCRFWLWTHRQTPRLCKAWFHDHARYKSNGVQWRNLEIPRFAELRKTIPTSETAPNKFKKGPKVVTDEAQLCLDL